ncbi:hypothetical protein B0H17DRAFT_1240390 [Mycena rosella]|uniref:Uncharacterized protein n=1 Tax=Mycena rosella TaxID=1033263 RepID=A0AAD7D2I0_MYCRO|nr:hypothetical protein B0H17DRAFT_1240390 [Mycena rosella]
MSRWSGVLPPYISVQYETKIDPKLLGEDSAPSVPGFLLANPWNIAGGFEPDFREARWHPPAKKLINASHRRRPGVWSIIMHWFQELMNNGRPRFLTFGGSVSLLRSGWFSLLEASGASKVLLGSQPWYPSGDKGTMLRETEIGLISIQKNALRIVEHLGVSRENFNGIIFDGLIMFESDKTEGLTQTWLIGAEDPGFFCNRKDLCDELQCLAIGKEGTGHPANLRAGMKVVTCNPEEGTLTLGEVVNTNLILGGDGIGCFESSSSMPLDPDMYNARLARQAIARKNKQTAEQNIFHRGNPVAGPSRIPENAVAGPSRIQLTPESNPQTLSQILREPPNYYFPQLPGGGVPIPPPHWAVERIDGYQSVNRDELGTYPAVTHSPRARITRSFIELTPQTPNSREHEGSELGQSHTLLSHTPDLYTQCKAVLTFKFSPSSCFKI